MSIGRETREARKSVIPAFFGKRCGKDAGKAGSTEIRRFFPGHGRAGRATGKRFTPLRGNPFPCPAAPKFGDET